jgi:hypothetical protein
VLEASMKTFVNADGTVDGEVRMGGLPDEWRTLEGLVELKVFLSKLFLKIGPIEPETEGGKYWISIGVRFGPQNETEIGELAELYKRYRGLFQVSSYALEASYPSALQNSIVSIGAIIQSIIQKRGMPPMVIFIRVTWTPDGERPHRYKGESGKEED